MLKKILISVLSVLLFLILVTGIFRYAVGYCDDYLLPEGSAVPGRELEKAEKKTVDYFFAVDSPAAGATASAAPQNSSHGSGNYGTASGKAAYCAVIGKLPEENKYYYSIYTADGKQKAYGEFGTSLENCVIQDVRTGTEEIGILCEEDGLCVLYSISLSKRVNGGSMKITKKVEFNPQREGETLLKLLLPDEKMEYILAAGTSGAVLYGLDGQPEKYYAYAPKTVITCGVLRERNLFLCGAASAAEDGRGFSYGFAEAFSEDGTQLWSQRLLDKKDYYISAAMECQILPNGNLGIYGRYYDYSESDFIMTSLETERFDDFKIYGDGIDYYIYTAKIRNDEGGAVQSSAFLAQLSADGSVADLKVYSALNDFRVPSISQTGSLNKLDAGGNFILTIAQAKAADSEVYHLTISGKSVEIPKNLKVIYDLDRSGGVYVYLAENGAHIYNLKYFTSVEEFASGIRKLRRALQISSMLDVMPQVMPWFLISAIGVILLVAKHYWRDDCGNEENR